MEAAVGLLDSEPRGQLSGGVISAALAIEAAEHGEEPWLPGR